MASQIEIFFCYAREDEELRRGLEKQLRALQQQGLIDIWHDRAISPGSEWKQEIDKHLNTAQIILLLISPDFMASDYAYGTEMKRAMERHECGEARVIPIILRPVYWSKAPFGKLQVLPTNAQPINSSTWHNLDEAFFDVAEGIRIAVEEIILKRSFSLLVTSTTLDLELDEPLSTVTAYLSTSPQITEININEESSDELPDWDSLSFDEELSDNNTQNTNSQSLPIPTKNTTKESLDDLPDWDSLSFDEELSDNNTQNINEEMSGTSLLLDSTLHIEHQYQEPNPIIKSIQKADSDQLLSVQKVKEKWEDITRRIRTKQGGAKIVALLKGYTIIGIENTLPRSTLVIQAPSTFHYEALQKKEVQEFIIWAINVEMNMELHVRILIPNKPDNDFAIRALLPDKANNNSVTIQGVKEKWENVKKRVKTKKGGAKIAAFLNGYALISIENTPPLLTIIIQASTAFHYSGLQKREDQEIIEWALTIELNQKCCIRLLPS